CARYGDGSNYFDSW
nr:immunoglobulin heavy chain junction region [Macaca mulatta]